MRLLVQKDQGTSLSRSNAQKLRIDHYASLREDCRAWAQVRFLLCPALYIQKSGAGIVSAVYWQLPSCLTVCLLVFVLTLVLLHIQVQATDGEQNLLIRDLERARSHYRLHAYDNVDLRAELRIRPRVYRLLRSAATLSPAVPQFSGDRCRPAAVLH